MLSEPHAQQLHVRRAAVPVHCTHASCTSLSRQNKRVKCILVYCTVYPCSLAVAAKSNDGVEKVQVQNWTEDDINVLLTGEGNVYGKVEKKGMLPTEKWCASLPSIAQQASCTYMWTIICPTPVSPRFIVFVEEHELNACITALVQLCTFLILLLGTRTLLP
jgi:hypothetical protein